jgi:hypothetical protein
VAQDSEKGGSGEEGRPGTGEGLSEGCVGTVER